MGQIEGHLCSQWREAGLTAVDNSGLWRWLHLCQWAKRKDRFFCFSGVDYCFKFRNWLICIAAFRCLARSYSAGYVLVSFNKDMLKCYKSANVSFLSISAAYPAHKRLISYLIPSMLRRARTFAIIKNILSLKVKYSKYSNNTADAESILSIFLFSFRFAFWGTGSWNARGPSKVRTWSTKIWTYIQDECTPTGKTTNVQLIGKSVKYPPKGFQHQIFQILLIVNMYSEAIRIVKQ